jgi:anti-sigma B factor antagonist
MHSVSIKDNQVYVLITGALDVKQAAELRTDLFNLAASGHNAFMINLSQTKYMDSTGLGVFVSLRNRLAESCGTVKIMGLNGSVEQLFITTRLKEVFCG